jgi:predicted Zn finger-like uncharacterized protein
MNPEARAIDVTCPNCEARYLLPAHLLFPTGSRARCPGCSQSFDVPPSPDAGGPETPPAPASPPPHATATPPPLEPPPHASPGPKPGSSPPGAEATPGEVARAVLEALAVREGEEIDRSAAEGRLFARFGPAIFAAYDEYRRRMKDGGPGPFRVALQERWGIELPEITPRF